jgi:hypothetical protein
MRVIFSESPKPVELKKRIIIRWGVFAFLLWDPAYKFFFCREQ